LVKDAWFALGDMANSRCRCPRVDWTCSDVIARYLPGGNKTLSGAILTRKIAFTSSYNQKKWSLNMINEFGKGQICG